MALPHLDTFGLAGFTAGSVCIAPRLSMRVLAALKARDFALAERLLEPIRPLETLRTEISPIRVLHEAVRLAGVADTGPLYPMLTNLGPERQGEVRAAVGRLLAAERELEPAPLVAAK